MREEMDDFYIEGVFSGNKTKSCWNCERFSNKMWKKNGKMNPAPFKYRCRECAIGKPAKVHPDFTGPFLPSELQDGDNLSVGIAHHTAAYTVEFFYRLCCSGATNTLSIKQESDFDEKKKVDHDFLKNLLHQHKESE
ncbi:unnamed protein product [Oikopleura dioica]|uniref:Uncharacterized protein n=1 Tax=Oikopleura dioica TaxID=34765 RepID=E4X827_OIKDI|nr:unnamed protein product [Oikopleura dioica]